MKKLLMIALTLALVFCIVPLLPAQELDWEQTFGGPEGENVAEVRQTDDGGYLIFAYTESYGAGNGDAWLIKTDFNGVMEWDRTFGGTDYDYGVELQQTDDGGYLFLAYTESYGAGNSDAWLIKIDSDGVTEWDRTFGGTDYEYGSSVQQTSDGGYIILGITESYGAGDVDGWLIKTDASGVRQWDQTFGGPLADRLYNFYQTDDGGYVIIGSTRSYGAGSDDVWLIKTDSGGVMQWDQTFGGPLADRIFNSQQTDDGGYVIVGRTRSYGAVDEDVWLFKTDSGGVMEWNRTFGGPSNDNGYGVQQTSDGGYIITGKKGIRGYDVWLIKTDSDGIMEWDKTFGGEGWDMGHSVQQTKDEGYIIAGLTTPPGTTTFDVWLIKVESPDCTLYDRYYRDSDGDGYYGDSSDYRCLESPSAPYTAVLDGDCNDNDPDINPGSVEICDDGIDNDCDMLVDSEELYCQRLVAISCMYPPNESVLYSSPSFTWMAYGGTNNRFAVDLSTDWTFSWYASTYEHLHQPIRARNWMMPQGIWGFIPSGGYVYWRVRGVDLNADPFDVITSDEVRWFYKY